MTTPFSIIIITLNEQDNLPNLLNDLIQQTQQNFEVIVCDSNSDDNTVAVARQFSEQLDLTTVVMNKRGTSLGRNTGAQHATHEHLIFFDADVRIRPDFLEKADKALYSKKLLVAGGRLSSRDRDWKARWGIRLFDIAMLITQFVFPTCAGACIFSTKTVHETIGGFNEAISLCEDCDYVKRASQTFKFRMLNVFFEFHPRRIKKDGALPLAWTYLRANIYRLFFGEITNSQIDYPFGHYDDKPIESRIVLPNQQSDEK